MPSLESIAEEDPGRGLRSLEARIDALEALVELKDAIIGYNHTLLAQKDAIIAELHRRVAERSRAHPCGVRRVVEGLRAVRAPDSGVAGVA